MKNPNQNKPTLTLVRGLPGSGKSTLAQRLCVATAAIHLEADMFMIDEDGYYEFDPGRLMETHTTCETKCREGLTRGKDVVVSNTFTRFWEMKAYIQMARELDIPLQIVECHGRFGSIHQVPDEAFADMRARWEDLPEEYR